MRRLSAIRARSWLLPAMHGWAASLVLIVSACVIDRWSALILSEQFALAFSIAYILVLCMLCATIVRSGLLRVAWFVLFVCWMAIPVIRSYALVVSSHQVGHWLRTELSPHAGRSEILSFVARHRNTYQAVKFETIDGAHWITMSYLHQGWPLFQGLLTCVPDVLVEFELSSASRLKSIDVSEQQTCS